jgi:formylglycine-generating enzyme required for sulfatase activity
VTHREAESFAGRMQARLRMSQALPKGWKLRLPYEAEWEYAMRAGGRSMYGANIDSRNLFDHAWLAGNSGGQLAAVASRKTNAWGIHDGLGSVMEWCADRYAPQFAGGVNPRGSYDESWQWVYRGGAFGLDSRYSQLSCRHAGSDTVRGAMLGFRLVLVRERDD